MRVIVGHGPRANPAEWRQILLGSGLDCGADDCVGWEQLGARLGQGDVDLVLVEVEPAAEAAWRALEEASQLTASPVMGVGAADQAELVQRVRRSGAVHVLDQSDIRRSLDTALDQWLLRGQLRGKRGRVISVFAPTPGSGGSTVAANLAGALARRHPDDVALVELAAEFGDLAVLLNVTPRHTAEDICRRWATLDRTCLTGSYAQHESGLHVLVNGADRSGNQYLSMEAARRLAILSRMTKGYTVLALDAALTEVELEAMRLSDAVAFVVRPDVPAVKRAQRAVQRLAEGGIARERIWLVVNRYGQAGQLPLSQLEASLGLRTAHLIPEDPRSVNRAANFGLLLQQQSRLRKISRRFAALAQALNGQATKTVASGRAVAK